jgi:hypothetical protein
VKRLRYRVAAEFSKRTVSQKGFVIILLLLLIAAAGAEMFVLTTLSNTMLFESDTAHLQALERNITASGLAWAKQNLQQQSEPASGATAELDVAGMGIAGAGLKVTLDMRQDRTATVVIDTRCSRGKYTLRQSHKYHIVQ